MAPPVVQTKDLDLYYGDFQALTKVSVSIAPEKITEIGRAHV